MQYLFASSMRGRRSSLRAFAFALTVSCLTGFFPFGPAEAERAERAQTPDVVPGELIVKFREPQVRKAAKKFAPSTAKGRSAVAQNGALRRARRSLVRRLGLQHVQDLKLVGAERVKIKAAPQALRAKLEKNVELFEYVEPNAVVHPLLTPSDSRYREQWALNQSNNVDIDAPEAWDICRAVREVIVAVTDTGADYTHPDLQAALWRNPGEIAGNGKDDDGNGVIDDVYGADYSTLQVTGDPKDTDSHGTHVSGIIAAPANSTGIVGVAGPCGKVKVMAVRIIGASSGVDRAIEGIDYVIRMKKRSVNPVGVAVINASWGIKIWSTPLQQAIARARDAGILFVAAAGNAATNNDDPAYPMYPAAYDLENVVAVASIDQTGQLSYFSNYGPKTVHLAAPGRGILSTIPQEGGVEHAMFSGTSMAAPHVSGVAALVAAQTNSISAVAIKKILLDTVKPLPALNGKLARAGTVDAYNALRAVPSASAVISGRVTLQGAALAGVTIDAGALGKVTTDAGGNYEFTGVAQGASYRLTPQGSGYTFSPAYSAGTLNGDVVHNFAAAAQSPASYPLSGRVTLNGAGLAGVTISDPVLGSKKSNTAGNFSFGNLPAGTKYNLTAALAGYTFTGANASGTINAATVSNFTATVLTYNLSGYVTVAGKALSGVTIDGGSLGKLTTDSAGYFVFKKLPYGTPFAIEPIKAGYSFSPASASGYMKSTRRRDFAGTLLSYTLSGYVKVNGAALSGVKVDAGALGSRTTNSAGYFAFDPWPYDTLYTLQLSKSGYTFNPSTITGGLGSDDVKSFTAAASSCSISGTVTVSGAPLAGVKLGGGALGSYTTGADGKYAFNGLAAGSTFNITPSRAGYSFNPIRGSGTACLTTMWNFSATRFSYTISGKVTLNGAALKGVTISEATLGSRTTDASGNYSFQNVPADTSFKLVARRAGYTFTPASARGTVTGATVRNFTAAASAPAAYTVSGKITKDGAPLTGVVVDGSSAGKQTTSASGAYSFIVSAGTTITLTPALSGMTFNPSSVTVTVSQNKTVDFTASAAVTYHVAQGRVRLNGTSQGLDGVRILFDTGFPNQQDTRYGGYWGFSAIKSGTRFKVTPSKAGYKFTPAYVEGVITQDAEINFVAIPQ